MVNEFSLSWLSAAVERTWSDFVGIIFTQYFSKPHAWSLNSWQYVHAVITPPPFVAMAADNFDFPLYLSNDRR
jgi:hypothetical protein